MYSIFVELSPTNSRLWSYQLVEIPQKLNICDVKIVDAIDVVRTNERNAWIMAQIYKWQLMAFGLCNPLNKHFKIYTLYGEVREEKTKKRSIDPFQNLFSTVQINLF